MNWEVLIHWTTEKNNNNCSSCLRPPSKVCSYLCLLFVFCIFTDVKTSLTRCFEFAFSGCQFTYSLNGIRDEQIEFTSPKFYDDGYPLFQTCTWRFAAPEKQKVHIEFLEMDIENDDSVKIYTNSWKGDGPAYTLDESTPPNVKGYGEARFLFMEFQSKNWPDSSKKKSKGFRGVFKVKGGEGKIQIA